VKIILQKLHVRTRTEAALLAVQHGDVGRIEKI
jgi:DNA-binding NarL/FixJ family response regulator